MQGPASAPHFNPFAGGPRKALGTRSNSGTSSGSGRLTLAAAAPILRAGSSGGSGSGGEGPNSAKLAEMERNPPSWLISPGRLVLEQGSDGQLILLGRVSSGSFGCASCLPACVRATDQQP